VATTGGSVGETARSRLRGERSLENHTFAARSFQRLAIRSPTQYWSTMTKRMEDALSVALTTAAIVLTLAVVWRQVVVPRSYQSGSESRDTSQLEYVRSWRDLISNGRP
jgi:hypothetical protein